MITEGSAKIKKILTKDELLKIIGFGDVGRWTILSVHIVPDGSLFILEAIDVFQTVESEL